MRSLIAMFVTAVVSSSLENEMAEKQEIV